MSKVPWPYQLQRLAWSGVDLLFPPECGGCGKRGSAWCQTCQSRVLTIGGNFCQKCGIPLESPIEKSCKKCIDFPPSYQQMRSWAVFDGPVQKALHTLKYRKNLGIGYALAVQFAAFVLSLEWQLDAVIPMPLGKLRSKQRGYNQVELVAKPVAYMIEVPYSNEILKKTRDTRSQVGLGVSQRLENVLGAYNADPNLAAGLTFLLVDDVATTGATVQAAAQALLDADAREVYTVTIARALTHHGLNVV